jgi:DNA-binding CsgD family transcriptional regulator/PAS domain-containing protein
MDEVTVGDLIERIYETALEPGLWPDLIEDLAAVFGGHAGGIEHEHVQSDLGAGLVIGLDPSVLEQYFGYYAGRNVLRRVTDFGAKLPSFVPIITVDTDSMPKEELAKTEFYNDFLRPIGVRSILSMGLGVHDRSLTALSLYRPFGRPDFDRDERALAQVLHPHLIRAFRIGRKLAQQVDAGKALAAGLEQSPQGVIVLNADGQVQHVNAAAERLLAQPGGVSVLGGRLLAADAADSDRLWQLICRAQSADGRIGGDMRIRRPDGRPPLSLTVAPVRTERLSLFAGRPAILVCLTDPEAGGDVSDAYLREELGLTASEAKVVHALTAGQSLRQIARTLGVGLVTVRSHLYRAFDKAGVRRQAELVALVARGGKPIGPDGL